MERRGLGAPTPSAPLRGYHPAQMLSVYIRLRSISRKPGGSRPQCAADLEYVFNLCFVSNPT